MFSPFSRDVKQFNHTSSCEGAPPPHPDVGPQGILPTWGTRWQCCLMHKRVGGSLEATSGGMRQVFWIAVPALASGQYFIIPSQSGVGRHALRLALRKSFCRAYVKGLKWHFCGVVINLHLQQLVKKTKSTRVTSSLHPKFPHSSKIGSWTPERIAGILLFRAEDNAGLTDFRC